MDSYLCPGSFFQAEDEGNKKAIAEGLAHCK